ncbi:hypothetical protein I3256_18750 [Photobacterium damselae]|uniref:hypothetical protein n=1 Tax=Photobacterium damselae TaxID=38293 RepID=UPI001EDD2137|nr:hypothetical protein [Photobacterium damselae]MCG3817983.1 hypothetical protein [Photobacterium damselae]
MINNSDRKSQRAVSTRLVSRTAMFLPVKQVSKNFASTDIEVVNNYGTITLRDCKLTQVHRNIVDVIFSNYEPIKMAEGAVAFTFSKYDVLKELGHSSKRNTKWLETKLEEMRKASVVLVTDDKAKTSTSYQGVIREHQETVLKSGNGQPLYGVVFSANFMKMFDHDLNIHSAKLTPIILQFEHAVTQAFARACISHRQLNVDLDEMLLSIGVNKANVSDRAYAKNRKAVLDEREALEQQLGITIQPMKKDSKKWGVFYEQHSDVWFSDPTKKHKPANKPDPIDDAELV